MFVCFVFFSFNNQIFSWRFWFLWISFFFSFSLKKNKKQQKEEYHAEIRPTVSETTVSQRIRTNDDVAETPW